MVLSFVGIVRMTSGAVAIPADVPLATFRALPV
jgi:hypothetical protein